VRVVAAVLAVALFAAGCRGPRPRVVSAAHRPSPGGGSVVEAVIENTGGGEGEVEVEVTLHSGAGSVVRLKGDATLRAHERITVLLPAEVPADGSYRIEVTARYPVD
jgi:hypothetical protein